MTTFLVRLSSLRTRVGYQEMLLLRSRVRIRGYLVEGWRTVTYCVLSLMRSSTATESDNRSSHDLQVHLTEMKALISNYQIIKFTAHIVTSGDTLRCFLRGSQAMHVLGAKHRNVKAEPYSTGLIWDINERQCKLIGMSEDKGTISKGYRIIKFTAHVVISGDTLRCFSLTIYVQPVPTILESIRRAYSTGLIWGINE
ncbi:hypothetical protein BDY19DRAFT_910794 [Irpex rosettiformis]|uniref:Uncharacterized protein n=1 Tax=Irpex rosettiformis TaxID=378272 RepID=A0ACB8TMB3_9APHY|nr:hypothetical protein BDY19DRAFT_910794 [Irpex rosettiformis]